MYVIVHELWFIDIIRCVLLSLTWPLSLWDRVCPMPLSSLPTGTLIATSLE